MRIVLMTAAWSGLLFLQPATTLAQDSDIAALRAEVAALRADYEARISELERRLAVAEQNAVQANIAAQQATTAAPAEVSSQTAYNPAIGVIFQGQAWSYDRSPEDYAIQGFPFGGEAGPVGEGLGLGETELIMNANVDDKFTAWLTAALAFEDGETAVEIEEAWVEATALPAGFGARFGRFYSGIGYLNGKHSHTWDFVDQPMPYQAFLANQLVDNGIQLRWLAPTDTYLELGAEALQGGHYPAAGNAHQGFGTYSLFANLGGDVGASHSWLAGASYLDTSAVLRPSGTEDDPFLFTGDSRLVGLHFVWKWAPAGNWKQRNLVVQTEYLRRHEDGAYLLPAGVAPYDIDQAGWYAQAVYQPIPRWRFGARFDGLSTDDPGPAFDGTALAVPVDDPRRYSVMMDWSNSEFSRLRLQFTRDEAGPVDDNQWGLQYIHSIGAHGAHTF